MSVGSQPVDTRGAVLAFNEGAAAAERGEEDVAAELWQKALRLDPSLIPAARNLVTFYQNRSESQAELQLWELILAFDPFDTDHLVLQAAAYRRAGQLKRALESYHRAISIYPYFKFWYHELAKIYGDLGEDDEAALWRGRGDSLGADHAEICYEDGLRHVTAKRWTSARTCFEAVLDEFPANLDARLRLARVLERAGTPEEVVAQYQMATELTKTAKGLVHYRLGEFYVKGQKLEEAVAEFETAVATVRSYGKAERARLKVSQHLKASTTAAHMLPGNAQVRLLQPDEIGMERIADPPVYRSPQLKAPDPRLPWQQQVRQVLDQALSVPAPGGQDPRIALLVEPDRSLAGAVQGILSELRSLGRSLRADKDASHVFVIETLPPTDETRPGLTAQGWLGRDDRAQLSASGWKHAKAGLPLNSTLDALLGGAGEQGFNCLVAVGFGRCYELDGQTLDLVASAPLHCVCFLHPHYHYVDFRSAFAGRAANYIEIAL